MTCMDDQIAAMLVMERWIHSCVQHEIGSDVGTQLDCIHVTGILPSIL